MNQFLISGLLCFILADAIPFSRNNLERVAYINCKNKDFVDILKNSKIPYRCLISTKAEISTSFLALDDNEPFKYEVKDSKKDDCSSANGCSTENESLQNDSPRRTCKSGYTLQRNRCIRDSDNSPKNQTPHPPKVSNGKLVCPKDFVYNPSVDLCLYVHQRPFMADAPHKPQKKQFIVTSDGPKTSLLGDREKVETKFEKSICGLGTIYNPSVDLCLPYNPPLYLSDMPYMKLISNNANSRKPDPFRLTLKPVKPKDIGKSKCKKGSIYVSEVDLCVDRSGKPTS